MEWKCRPLFSLLVTALPALVPFAAAHAQQCPGNFEPTSTAVTISDPNPVAGETITATATISPANTAQYNYNAFVTFDLIDNTTEMEVPGFPMFGSTLGDGVVSTLSFVVPGTDNYTIAGYYSGSRYCTLPSQGSYTFTPTAPGGAGGMALKGSYVFLLQGNYIPSASPASRAAIIGQFVADGKGNITSGVIDSEGPADIEALPVKGTYTLDASGRGTLTLTSSQSTITLALSVPASQVGSTIQSGVFTTTGNLYLSGSGTLALQTVSEFTTASLLGSYLVKVEGEAACGTGCTRAEPVFATGQLTLSKGGKASATMDQTVGADAQPNTLLAGDFAAPSPTTGRTLLHLAATPPAPSEPSVFVLYPIDRTHSFAMSLEPHGDFILLSGTLQP